MESENINITATMLMDYIYCKRIPYFSKTLYIPQNAQNSFKVREGKRVHNTKMLEQGEYLRKRIDVKIKLVDDYLFSKKYDISGKVDEVLFFEDFKASPLDYKYSIFKGTVIKSYKMQLIFYSILIEENYNVSVDKGYIVYIRSKNRLEEIEFYDEDYQDFFELYEGLRKILENEVYPINVSPSVRCEECSYKNICMK